jgi:hypothetical protein
MHNTQQTQETGIHALSGIRTHKPINRVAPDPRLRPHGYRDRHTVLCTARLITNFVFCKDLIDEAQTQRKILVSYLATLSITEIIWRW